MEDLKTQWINPTQPGSRISRSYLNRWVPSGALAAGCDSFRSDEEDVHKENNGEGDGRDEAEVPRQDELQKYEIPGEASPDRTWWQRIRLSRYQPDRFQSRADRDLSFLDQDQDNTMEVRTCSLLTQVIENVEQLRALQTLSICPAACEEDFFTSTKAYKNSEELSPPS